MNQFRPRGGFGAIPPVVKNLLIINVLMYVSMHAINSAFNYDISQNLALFFLITLIIVCSLSAETVFVRLFNNLCVSYL